MSDFLTLVAALGTEGLKQWGLFSVVLILLMWRLWRQGLELKAERTEVEKLTKQLGDLQEKRLEEAKQMIRVAETGTATMATRAQGDAEFLDLMRRFLEEMAAIKDGLGPHPPSRSRRR